jgi:imidazolonepropionase-like amidohydrolase
MKSRLLAALACASAAALVALASTLSPTPAVRDGAAAAGPPSRFVVVDARVFDGEALHPRASVQVADGRIEAIAATLAVPAGYQRIEGTGRTLLPGFIDAHVHTWGEARRDALRFGVTTLLDMFSDHRQLAAARAQRASTGAGREADLWSAGTLATAAGGHGTQFGLPIPTLSTPAEAAPWVAARKAEGSDWIKLVREDLHVFTDARRLPTLDDATAAALIAAAHSQGLRALVHASGREHARASLRDGADGLVHSFEDAPADAALLALARERGAFVVPTLSVVAAIGGEKTALGEDPRLAPFLTPAQRQTLQAGFDFGPPRPALLATARANTRALHAAGVPLLVGTDAPNPGTAHGASVHGELAQMVQAGLSPAEALAAATAVPARAFGLADRGRIAAGLRADLLLVEGEPDRDIEATRAIVTIWKNGRAVDRSATRPVAEQEWEAGPVSDFDAGTLASRSGLGWSATSDRMAGGASQVEVTPVAGGVGSGRGAMRVAGTVVAGAPYPWAGAMLSPGPRMFAPVDARARRELVFQARGDGRELALLLFSGAEGSRPAMRPFTPGPEWREVRLPLADFAGVDLGALRGVAVTAGLPAGAFWFELDAVEIR